MNRAEVIHTASPMSNRASRGSALQRRLTPVAQRRADGPASGTRNADSIVHDVLRSEGLPLEGAARRSFEPRFGHDFAQVRIHSDVRSAASAHALNALAYTVGHHIVFASGRYAPHTMAAKHLLAHELAHVVQQAGASSSLVVQRTSTDQPAQRDAQNPVAVSGKSAATQQIIISGETFDVVGVGQPLTAESPAWRYRADVNDYVSVYPNLGNGWWALIVRSGDGAPCNIGGNCLGWTYGSYTTSDPSQEVWDLAKSYLDSIDRPVRGKASPLDIYLRQVEKDNLPAPALWDYYMAQRFQAVPAATEGDANLALYGRGFGGPADGPSHIAFRTGGGEQWVSKPSAAKPPVLHETAAQMTGGETGDVLRLYACPSGPPNRVLLSKAHSQGRPSP